MPLGCRSKRRFNWRWVMERSAGLGGRLGGGEFVDGAFGAADAEEYADPDRGCDQKDHQETKHTDHNAGAGHKPHDHREQKRKEYEGYSEHDMDADPVIGDLV